MGDGPQHADCARLLGVPLPVVEVAAGDLEPYLCGDGRTHKWSVAELADRLGVRRRDHTGARLTRRAAEDGRARRAARNGARATMARRAAQHTRGPVLDDPLPATPERVEDLAEPDVAGVEDLAAAGGQ
jgi:hypothetical protein